MWIQPTAGVSTMCMNSTNNAFGIPVSASTKFSVDTSGNAGIATSLCWNICPLWHSCYNNLHTVSQHIMPRNNI